MTLCALFNRASCTCPGSHATGRIGDAVVDEQLLIFAHLAPARKPTGLERDRFHESSGWPRVHCARLAADTATRPRAEHDGCGLGDLRREPKFMDKALARPML